MAPPVLWQYNFSNFNEKARWALDERAQKKVAAGLDRIVGELGSSGYLAGSRFTVADLTAAALLFPLARPAELQYDYPEPPRSQLIESLAGHPGVDWIREIYRRQRSPSTAITG